MAAEKERRAFVTINGPDSQREELRAFAMAAAVLGVPLRPLNDFVEYRRRKEGGGGVQIDVAWFLEQRSPDGEQKTNQLWLWWNDPAWLSANPGHPLARFKEYWQALKDARAHEEKVVPLAVVTRGNRTLHIPFDVTPERKAKLLALLNE
jgi:hypothetical protein